MIKDFLKAIAAIGICAAITFSLAYTDARTDKHIKEVSSVFVADIK